MTRCTVAAKMPLQVVFVLVGMLVIAPIALAQTGDDALRFTQRFPGYTASSIGLAGTGIAGVADPSALILNPAGLGLFRASSISGSFSSSEVTDESFYRVPGASFPGESDVTNTGVGSLSAIYKVPTSRGSLVLAIAFNQITTYERNLFFDGENDRNSITDYFMPLPGEFEFIEDGDDFYPDFFRTPSFIAFETFAIDFDQGLFDDGDPVPFLPAVSAGTVAQIGSVVEEGRMNELNFGGAFEASKDIFVGASVNIPFAQYTFTRTFEEDDIFNDNDGENGTTDFSYLSYEETFESDMVGINARLGLSAKVSPQIRVGATIETPTIIAVDEKYHTVLFTEFDNGDAFEYGDELAEDAGTGFFEYDITTPWRLGVGASYRSAGLTLLADVEVVDWSQLELDSKDVSYAAENRDIQRQFDAIVNTRLAASYETGDFIIRGGVALYPDPHDESFAETIDGSLVDKDRKFFSIGLGYRISRELRVDLGWIQERFDDVYRPYTEVADAPFVEEEIVRNRFQIGIRYTL